MANKISISTKELETQANKLYALGSHVDDITLKSGKAMRLIEEALSSKFTSNMEEKSKALMKNIRSLRDNLYVGSKVAFQCATSYQNADIVLRKVIGDSLPDEIKDTNKNPPSQQQVKNEFQTKVDDMKAKDGFKQGDYNYNDFMNGVSSYNGQPVGGAQCYAMAHMMQIEVLGARGYNCGTTSFDDIKVGDVIHYKGGGADANWGHWVFVTDVQPGKIVVSEANWDPPYGGTVSYGREITKGSIEIQEIRRV